jgi:hypothetical protein
MKLSIVIPCYNEAKTIRQIVERVSPTNEREIIIAPRSSAAQRNGLPREGSIVHDPSRNEASCQLFSPLLGRSDFGSMHPFRP